MGSSRPPTTTSPSFLHHVAISVEPAQWERARQRLDEAGVAYLHESGTSLYFRDPDGARTELIADRRDVRAAWRSGAAGATPSPVA